MTDDMVNHPPHYQHPSGIESIEIKELLPSNLGDAWKYTFRIGDKWDALEDWEKAMWYINRYSVQPEFLFLFQEPSPTLRSILERDIVRIIRAEPNKKKARALRKIISFYLYKHCSIDDVYSVFEELRQEIVSGMEQRDHQNQQA